MSKTHRKNIKRVGIVTPHWEYFFPLQKKGSIFTLYPPFLSHTHTTTVHQAAYTMADAGMYTTNGDEEEDMTALLHTAVPGSNAAHTSQAQEEAPVPAFGKPFHEDIPKEAGVRSIGEWVHPQQRALREWYGMQCSCGAELTFPWLGFEVVSCPTCGSHVSSEKAVVAKVPGASIQAKAQEDEERLSALVNSEKKKDLAARRFVERFSFMRRRWDTMERLFFGKASLYGRFKMYQNGRIILSPTSSYCVIPPLIVAPALIAMMQLSLPIIWSQIVGAALVAAFIGVTVWRKYRKNINIKHHSSPISPNPAFCAKEHPGRSSRTSTRK